MVTIYVYYNPNPLNKTSSGDCQVRACCKAFADQYGDWSWERVYTEMCVQGYIIGNVPSANETIETYLRSKGFQKEILPNTCPNCMTFGEFCEAFPNGTYILCTGSHMACCKQGFLYDSWPSLDEPVLYYYRKLGERG